MLESLQAISEPLQWFATITSIAAALTVSLNLGARITGYAFVVFTASSLSWIAIGLLQGEPPLTIQNIVLTIINVIGIYRWLFIRAEDQDRAEEVEELAEAAAERRAAAILQGKQALGGELYPAE